MHSQYAVPLFKRPLIVPTLTAVPLPEAFDPNVVVASVYSPLSQLLL
jgi:hypothetical protein